MVIEASLCIIDDGTCLVYASIDVNWLKMSDLVFISERQYIALIRQKEKY